DDDHHPDREDEDVGVLQHQVGEVARAEEVAVEEREQPADDDERDDDAALPDVAPGQLPRGGDGVHRTTSGCRVSSVTFLSRVMSRMRFSCVASAVGTSPVTRPNATV